MSKIFTLLLVGAILTLSVSALSPIEDIMRPHIDPVYMKQKYHISEGEFFAVLDHARSYIYNKHTSISHLPCSACQSTFTYLLSFELNTLMEIIKYISVEYCILTKIEGPDVCRGAVNEMTPIILHSVMKHYLDPLRICPAIFLCSDFYQDLDLKVFINDTLRDKPVRPDAVPTGRATFKLVHVTDMHIDFDYAAGYEADCGEPECCQTMHGTPKSPESASGYWGTLKYNCDLPSYTLQQGLDFIAENIDPELMVWTGDTVDHTIWRQSQQKDIYATVWAVQEMKKRFNNSKLTVYPIDGNHECFPVNTFDYNSGREDPLRIAFSESWKDWIGEEAAAQVRKNVFYSSYHPKYNIRVIAMDTNTCPDGNYFLLENPTDPGGMLSWLKDQLHDAESKGQFVYIIGHIPSDGCMYQWAARFEAIVDRYSDTIRGQFFGHTHSDLFQVLYTQDGSKPVGVQYIAPSLTTITDRRPAIREFEVDADTGIPVKIRQYRLNLTKYNAMGKVDKILWEETYNSLTEYNMTDLTFNSMHNLRNRIRDEPETGAKIIRNNDGRDGATGNATNYYCSTISIGARQDACNSGQSIEKRALGLLERLGGPWIERIKKQQSEN